MEQKPVARDNNTTLKPNVITKLSSCLTQMYQENEALLTAHVQGEVNRLTQCFFM